MLVCDAYCNGKTLRDCRACLATGCDEIINRLVEEIEWRVIVPWWRCVGQQNDNGSKWV